MGFRIRWEWDFWTPNFSRPYKWVQLGLQPSPIFDAANASWASQTLRAATPPAWTIHAYAVRDFMICRDIQFNMNVYMSHMSYLVVLWGKVRLFWNQFLMFRLCWSRNVVFSGSFHTLRSVTLWDLLHTAGMRFLSSFQCLFCLEIHQFSLWCLLEKPQWRWQIHKVQGSCCNHCY